jgi:holo-[acyl-carrier protein] synthase
MKLATGIDLIEIQRLEASIARFGERFLQRVFTAGELAEVGSNTASLAARFAAKEAVAKALGCGIGLVSWREIEVRRGPASQPELRLHGCAASLAADQGLTKWSLSLSHNQSTAVAVVVAFGE